MDRMLLLLVLSAALLIAPGCERNEAESEPKPTQSTAKPESDHTHADGSTHDDHAEPSEAPAGEDHHDEVSIGTATIGDMQVELAQGHGKIEAGKEGHLVVKLPHNDKGETQVRAWLGTEDRTLSLVGLGTYAASHDDYDIHAMAPDPLPEDVMWWIEIEMPDGTKVVGSAEPLME